MRAAEAVKEIADADMALKSALRAAQKQTKLSGDIGYVLSPTSVKKAADAPAAESKTRGFQPPRFFKKRSARGRAHISF